jgi:hypothetical protein
MRARLVFAAGLGVIAWVGGGGTAAAQRAASDGAPRLETVWVDPVRDVAPDALAAGSISNLLYVNRCVGDCVLTPGQNDARANTSSIIESTTTLSEFALGDEVYDEVIACLRDVYGPYDVEIVTEDPGKDTFHHEAILAGLPEEAGLNQNIGGIAPASCEPLNNVISFSFANVEGNDAETLCWTVAQESAHSFGLPNHVYDCLDPMTYLPGPCGRKYFRNRGIECGEFEPKECVCGVSAQNSHVELLATFGPGTAPPPPEVTLLYPEPDQSVTDNFSIFFNAADPRLVHHADIYLNGTLYKTLPGNDYADRDEQYDVEAPDLPDGLIDVEIRAFNEINSEEAGTATITVVKGEPCTSADQCFEFMECNDGHCEYPPPAGRLGDECGFEQYCLEGTCAEVGGERRCADTCNPNVSGSCPDGFECLPEGVCWESGEGGGCCAVAGGQGRDENFPLLVLSLFAGAIVLVRRGVRARRRRA